MKNLIHVTFRDTIFTYDEDTTLYEMSKDFKRFYNYPIILAKADNDLKELHETLTRDCTIEFYDRSSTIGYNIYVNSVNFVMILALKRVLGSDVQVIIDYSIDKGIYCSINNYNIDKQTIKKVEKAMEEICQEDLVFKKLSVERIDAIKYYKKDNQMDKVQALKYISNSYINLYRLDDTYDYFYSHMAYSTKQLDSFCLTYLKDNGFVLSYPTVSKPEETLPYVHHKKLFNKFLEYNNWCRTLGIENCFDLNREISLYRTGEIIRLGEINYDSQIMKITEDIVSEGERIKVVLIAGPTSSGKTTTARKLQIFLRSKGLNPHQVSVDDYFKDREDTPKDEDGEYDFESLKAIDVPLFNRHLKKLLNGDKVLMPEYNFKKGIKEYKNNWLQLKDKDIIIIEGLHALNEELTNSVDRFNKYKIYISPLTALNIDNHNRIYTTDIRKLRRIVRDAKYRGHPATDTLKMWKNIKKGEEKYIFPFQDDADVVCNSSLIYEIGVLKTYAEPLLFSVDEEDENYHEALRLINFLRNVLPIPSDEVPKDSVLREFIGGSYFHEKK